MDLSMIWLLLVRLLDMAFLTWYFLSFLNVYSKSSCYHVDDILIHL